MSTFEFLWAAFAVLGGGMLLTRVFEERFVGKVAFISTFVAGVFTIIAAARVWVTGPASTQIQWLMIKGFPATPVFTIDRFSALFMGIIGFLGILSVLYSQEYLKKIKGENSKRYYSAFLMFILGMLAVVTTADLFYFLLFWELMTLASYFLVVYERGVERNLKAGWTYFFATHVTSVGLMLVVIMFGGWANSFAFADMPAIYQHLTQTNPTVVYVIIGLLFIAFATKAGIYPFSFWLPEAYRSAPASTSAMLSGVMSKLAVYGLVRFTFWMLPASNVTVVWGFIIATAGTLSMIVGNLRTLNEDDAKRLVAQSSIGQMGYIWLGIGIAMMFLKVSPTLAMVAMVGSLFHLINHACFKSLLFFNTGSVEYVCGHRDLNHISGLIKVVPVTAAAALIGTLAIAGVPLFNGFASKWMLYQASLLGGKTWPVLGFYGVVAVFISTVSLAAYMKFFGPAFLGPVPDDLQGKKDLPFSMKAVELILGFICILGGIIPALPVSLALGALTESAVSGPAAGAVSSAIPAGIKILAGGGIAVSMGHGAFGQLIPSVIAGGMLVICLLCYLIYRIGNVSTRTTKVWSCGEESLASGEMLYRARSFYQPFKEHFTALYRQRKAPAFKMPACLEKILDLDNFYMPFGRSFVSFSRWFSKIHRGQIQFYLVWQIFGLVTVLGLMFYVLGGWTN